MKTNIKILHSCVIFLVFVLSNFAFIAVASTNQAIAAVSPSDNNPLCFHQPPSSLEYIREETENDRGSWKVKCPDNRPDSESPDYFQGGNCYLSKEETAFWGDFITYDCGLIDPLSLPYPASDNANLNNSGNRSDCKKSKNPEKCQKAYDDCSGLSTPDRIIECKQAVLESNKVAPNTKGDIEGSGSASDTEDSESPDCSADLNSPLSWIICPLVDMTTAATDFFFEDLVKPLLDEVPISTQANDPGYKAWQGFRLIANLVLVGALLVLVYSTMRGGGR